MPTYKTVAKGTLYGINCVSVFNYQTDVPSVGGDEEDDINESWVVDVMPTLVAIQSSDFRWNCVSTSVIGPGSASIHDKTLTAANDGLVAEDALPPNKVYRATLYSATLNGHGRGRKYFSGIPETWEDDNAIILEQPPYNPGALLGDLQTALGAPLSGGPFGGIFTPVVYSTDLATAADVIKVTVSPQVSSMRSRTARRC